MVEMMAGLEVDDRRPLNVPYIRGKTVIVGDVSGHI